jgi:hypothetical protein
MWFTKKSEISPETIFQNIWMISDINDEKKYSILGRNNTNSDLKDDFHLRTTSPQMARRIKVDRNKGAMKRK